MLQDVLLLLVIINPFGQMVYLSELMTKSPTRVFLRIYFSATILGIIVCLTFAWLGEIILFDIFQISLAAMRIFGGLIILSVAFTYIRHGPNGVRLFRGEVTEVAQRIALPLMVGPGVIWMSIKIGNSYFFGIAALIICGALIFNDILVLTYFRVIKTAKRPLELAMVKYFAIAMRLNAFMMGAVSVDMILKGISEYYLNLAAIPKA
ncbi:MAG: MarC family protein [bacterium]